MSRLKALHLAPTTDYTTGELLLTFTIDKESQYKARELIDKHLDRDKPLSIEVKAWRNPRSLDANAYCWALLSKMANVLKTSKDEVYVEMLKRYGQTSTDDDGTPLLFSVKAGINVFAVYKYVAEVGTGSVNGEPFVHYRALRGSSEFDSSEMGVFIDGIISECKDLAISTDTPSMVDLLKREWRQ